MKGGAIEFFIYSDRYMSKDELKKCGCGCNEEETSCGCGEDHGCGCGEHNHDECGCGCGEHEHEFFVVDLIDEEGNSIPCPVVDAFEFNDKEYVVVENPEDGNRYVFRTEGEDGELFDLDEKEYEEVSAFYESLMEEEE